MEFNLKNGICLVLAGGLSQRLFPLSVPKPLLEIRGRSLLDQSLSRLSAFSKIYVCCNQATSKQIQAYRKKKKLKPLNFILEPSPRDTAAAVGWALRKLRAQKPAWVAVFSADQFFPQTRSLRPFLNKLVDEMNSHPESLFLAGSNRLSKAESTHSQYGWICRSSADNTRSSAVTSFVEKPAPERLAELHSNAALINCGMFFGGYGVFMNAYATHFPEAVRGGASFAKLPKQPIDRAIFEKWHRTRVLELNDNWEDLGTWENVAKFQKSQPYYSEEDSDSFVFGELGSEIYIQGLEDIAVIQIDGKTLISPLAKTRDLKTFLNTMKKRK